jgi:nucleotide-binding universal stress UspA family protein
MNRFKNILVVASDEVPFEPIALRAGSLARRNGARMTLLGVIDSERTERRVVMRDGQEFDVGAFLVQTRRDELEEVAAGVDGVDVQVAVTTGTGFVEVIRSVVALGHDLVVVAADGTPKRRLAGATMAMHLLRKCPVPVWVDSGHDGLEHDVAVAVGPFDGPPARDSLDVMLLELGTSLAAMRGGALHVVHAWRLEGESLLRRGRARPPAEQVDAMVEDAHREAIRHLESLMAFQPDLDVATTIHILKGEAGSVIPAVMEEARPGVVVMGTLARAGLKGVFMGNTAERVLGTIDASVLAVKPRGFETPVGV